MELYPLTLRSAVSPARAHTFGTKEIQSAPTAEPIDRGRLAPPHTTTGIIVGAVRAGWAWLGMGWVIRTITIFDGFFGVVVWTHNRIVFEHVGANNQGERRASNRETKQGTVRYAQLECCAAFLHS